MQAIENQIKPFLKSILNSYSQIFFSDNKFFGIILVLVSFFDFNAGICGISGVVLSNLLSQQLGFNYYLYKKGLYGFNSLLVCLGLGIYYTPGWQLVVLIIIAVIFTLFISIFLQGVFSKYGLPFLSLPFLLAFWTLTLAGRDFMAIGISERGIFTLNDLYALGGSSLVDLYNWWNSIPLLASLKTYFISLGAILFQYSILAGIIVAIGLLIYSRIAFSLSLLGFYAAYFFYEMLGVKLTDLHYSYIGFNYILTSIAVGGFFVIPSKNSYLWTVILVPVVAVITISQARLFGMFHLSIFSLPFNIVVLLFVYILKLRETNFQHLESVIFQYNQPERNLYAHNNAQERFKNSRQIQLLLPFWGEWTVSQAHNGKYTHKADWQHAWDFIITQGENTKSYKNEGKNVDDYYCYNKMLLSPAHGIIEEVLDGIDDNPIGEMNLKQNWGNTVIIKHAEGLYSKLSHLKKGSIKVTKGQAVAPQQVIAACGNSGRSPEPHLHFQIQATPYIGSKTIDYPLASYMLISKNEKTLKTFDKPLENQVVANIEAMNLLKNAFHFISGKKLCYEINYHDNTIGNAQFEVVAGFYQNCFIENKNSGEKIYLQSDNQLMFFKHFEGEKKSFTYFFYLSIYKVLNAYYQNLEITDKLPINQLFDGIPLFLQDFAAPFYSFLKAKYSIKYLKIDDDFSPSDVILNSTVELFMLNKKIKKYNFILNVNEMGLFKIEFTDRKNGFTAILQKEIL